MGGEMVVRVLQVVQSYYPAFVYGGPIFSIHYACQAMARQGIRISVATTNANGARKLDVKSGEPIKFEPNYHVCYYDDTIISRFSSDFCWHLWRDLSKTQVVHLQDVFSTYAAWTILLSQLAHKPILISARGTFTPWGLAAKRRWVKKLWLTLLVRPFIGNTQRVAWHATSAAERDEVLTQFPKARVHVVPNGIDCAAFDRVPAMPRVDYLGRFFPDVGVAPNRARVLTGLGRLHVKKAFHVAIRAVHILLDTQPDIVLLIAGGDDGESEPLKRQIAELGLADRVALVGEVKGDDKVAFLKGADLFLFPSHGENFGMVALEALAAGLPVVASRNTPWAELETEGTGLCVENTPEAFAAAVSALLAQDVPALSAAARAHAARFDLSAIAAAFKGIYEGLINDATP